MHPTGEVFSLNTNGVRVLSKVISVYYPPLNVCGENCEWWLLIHPPPDGHTQRQSQKPAVMASSWLHHTASLISLQDFFVSCVSF